MTLLPLLKLGLDWLRKNWLAALLASLLAAFVWHYQGLRGDLKSTKASLTAAEVVRDACLEGQKTVKADLDDQKQAVEDIKQGAKEHQQAAQERARDVLRAPVVPTPPPVTADDWNAWIQEQR